MELTHASFFSGVGGLDLGLERAGWRTVSFSEIDPYACAVLGERWPGVPNLGSIVGLATERIVKHGGIRGAVGHEDAGRPASSWWDATLWSGGFPCQDLSVAGKRRGMGSGTRSGLAYAFLDLVAIHRPQAVLLENVPGLLSSHGGRDMAALVGALVELGYGVGYRVLDARHFGVPQRRRRVFILGLTPGGRAGAERAAEVLSVGSRCRRHPPTGIEAGEGAAEGAQLGVDITRTVTGHSSPRGDGGDNLVSSSPDPDRMRAPDGLAGRSHDRGGVVNALDQRRDGADDNGPDSHRYRCCGNGVVSSVAEWIGYRLAEALP
jgi:DNA (cytosine-5)-methyltransferase 1